MLLCPKTKNKYKTKSRLHLIFELHRFLSKLFLKCTPFYPIATFSHYIPLYLALLIILTQFFASVTTLVIENLIYFVLCVQFSSKDIAYKFPFKICSTCKINQISIISILFWTLNKEVIRCKMLITNGYLR